MMSLEAASVMMVQEAIVRKREGAVGGYLVVKTSSASGEFIELGVDDRAHQRRRSNTYNRSVDCWSMHTLCVG